MKPKTFNYLINLLFKHEALLLAAIQGDIARKASENELVTLTQVRKDFKECISRR